MEEKLKAVAQRTSFHGMAKAALTAAATMLLLASCDQDPFGASYRQIAGGYYLHRWEDFNTFYLDDQVTLKGDRDGGGVLKGTIEEIGWNTDFIMARRHSTFRGDADGWMLVGVRDHRMVGPFSDSEITTMNETSGIRHTTPSEAWEMLR